MEYDLEDRTFRFASNIRQFVKGIKTNLINTDDCKQMIRSSGSVGANYIEANEALSRKDFFFRIRVCRKEAKETQYWLKLLDLDPAAGLNNERERLIKESNEFIKIFTQILKSDTETRR